MAKVEIKDLSGWNLEATDNPYDALLNACANDPAQLQAFYERHRSSRNRQQKAKILSDDSKGWTLDEVLVKLDGPQREEGYADPRNCLVFWARPPQKVKNLIEVVQQKIHHIVPGIWLMPMSNLHMTAMEVTHSRTPEEIQALIDALMPSAGTISSTVGELGKRPRLVKPLISFDTAAFALSFVPAAHEALPRTHTQVSDGYTYHHFRRDLYAKITEQGVKVDSRYVVPSAHLTIARFNTPNPFSEQEPMNDIEGFTKTRRQKLLAEIDLVNSWLQQEYWPKSVKVSDKETSEDHRETIKPGGEWIVGQEKGLDFRRGRLWYGGGESVVVGKANEMQK